MRQSANLNKSKENRRFYSMIAISVAINLFILPVFAMRWFTTARIENLLASLHVAVVKTVDLKPKPKPVAVPPKKIAKSPPKQIPAKQKRAPSPPSPRILAETGGTGPAESVIQGNGSPGRPALPSSPPAYTPPPPPKPTGPTKDAVPVSEPLPKIPDSLRSQELQTSVRVEFDITADGTAKVRLLTSSGSLELDRTTLETLSQWRWKPALKDGVPVSSVLRLRIEYEVQ